MDSQIDIIVPTFINCHLFWIIPKRNLLVRSAINRALKANHTKQIKDPEKFLENEMVALNIDDIWARGIINQVKVISNHERQFICWLPDYGIKRIVNYIFYLPENMKKCPHLARQASLHNVVNLMTDLTLGEIGYKFKLKKTINDIQGVRKVALDCIEGAEKLFFSVINEDEFNIYGDIIFLDQNNKQQSLTDFLIKKKLLGVDRNIFNSIETTRTQFKEAYFSHSQNLLQELDKTEKKNLNDIFNKEVNTNFPEMEFFKRKHFNDQVAHRFS